MGTVIVDAEKDDILVRRIEAEAYVESKVNNEVDNELYIVKYNGKPISLSCKYYKFAYKTLADVKKALTIKFGKSISKAMVESEVIVIYKIQV